MNKEFFSYTAMYLIMLLTLDGIEILILKPLIDFISTNYWIHLLVYGILIIFINPIIVRAISDILNNNYYTKGDSIDQ